MSPTQVTPKPFQIAAAVIGRGLQPLEQIGDALFEMGEGGRIVAQGTPEQVARNKKSYTGQALAEYFNGKTKKPSTAELLA